MRAVCCLFPAPSACPPLQTDDLISAVSDYQSLFLSQRREAPEAIALRLAEGSVPRDLTRGTYYLAGPGIFADDEGSTVHPFDGHGYLRAFRFGGRGGAVTYSARYVRTEAHREERDAMTGSWRFSYRGPFSVLRRGRRLWNVKVMKNVANTSVVSWGGKLLCLWEGGEPYELHPETLETVGPFDLLAQSPDKACDRRGGPWSVAAWFLRPILHGLYKMPRKRVLSHYKIDATRRRLMILCVNAEDLLLPSSNFTFYEFDEDFKLVQQRHFCIGDHLMIHDWAFTDNYYVLIANRVKIDLPGSALAASGIWPMISTLSTNPSSPTTPIYILPRYERRDRRDWRSPLELPNQSWALHLGNAFEQGNEDAVQIQLHATTCSYRWFNFQKMFGYDWQNGRLDPLYMNLQEEGRSPPFRLVKVSLRIDEEGNVGECQINDASTHSKRASDFPTINPNFAGRTNAYTYVATASGTHGPLPCFPFDSVAKVRVSDGFVAVWTAGPRRFVGEPVFVPRGHKEDDGYILVVEYAVGKQMCYLVILDATRIGEADAVVAKLEIPQELTFPLGFHGFWEGSNKP